MLTPDELARIDGMSWADWTAYEGDHGWAAPPWLVDPLDRPQRRFRVHPRVPWWARAELRAFSRRRRWWGAAHEAWDGTDALIIAGVEGLLLAWTSGRPFVFWPHGGDIRLAAGWDPPTWRRPGTRIGFALRSSLLRQASLDARAVASHDPSYVFGTWEGLDRVAREDALGHLCWPIPPRHRGAPADRRRRLEAALERLGVPVPSAEFIGLVPSRIDFFWKGHSELLDALVGMPADRVHVLFMGWGVDRSLAEQELARTDRAATVLPAVVSKPLLYELFDGCDFAVDQFRLGTYGGAAVEAMAGGCPVISWIDRSQFERRGWEPPPVLIAHDRDSIRRVIGDIALGRTDLEQAGASALAWHGRWHDPVAVGRQIDALLGPG